MTNLYTGCPKMKEMDGRAVLILFIMLTLVKTEGLVSVTTGSDYVVTRVGENQTISLDVSRAGGEFRVSFNDSTEYLFHKFNNSDLKRVNNNRTLYRDRYRVRGNITSSVFRLTLYNVTTEDAGIYECQKFEGNQRVPGCKQLLIVARNPSQPNITGPASAVSGGSVTLTCSSSSRSLPPDHPPLTMNYTWKRNSEEIQGGGDVSVDGPNLTMKDISREKAGNYTCQAKEEELKSDWSARHVLDVQYGPNTVHFNETHDKVTATEGDPLTVRCSADCNPACTVTWLDTSRQKVTSGQREAVLSIPAVNRSLSDLYTCHVNNTHGNKSRNLKLDIQYGPYTVQFNEIDDKVTATEGDPLTVTCSADCNPTCTVTWWDTYKQRVTSGHREAVLSIPAVNRSLSDLYTCHVNNTHGNKSRNLKLDIQYPPSVKTFSDISINNITRKVDSVSFLCVVDGNPKPSVYLRHDLTNRTYPMTCETLSKSIYTSHQYYECTHTNENFDVFLHGAYSCRAENTVGHVDSRAVVVTVPSK
ncbi:cell adhesion molecule CEACAM1-like [Haliotis cracherodii]|uniref:cell adhesion molecule CEACAM1-like n=1 Tax=Haliotis cracherodii TaxID=6455 RepID=UPI0039E94180